MVVSTFRVCMCRCAWVGVRAHVRVLLTWWCLRSVFACVGLSMVNE